MFFRIIFNNLPYNNGKPGLCAENPGFAFMLFAGAGAPYGCRTAQRMR